MLEGEAGCVNALVRTATVGFVGASIAIGPAGRAPGAHHFGLCRRVGQQGRRTTPITPATVCKWGGRFVRLRLDGLYDEPRPGRQRTITDEHIRPTSPDTYGREGRR